MAPERAPFSPGDVVESRWQVGRYFKVEAVKVWPGSPSGFLVACEGMAIPWVCASSLALARAGAKPTVAAPPRQKPMAQPLPPAPIKRVF